ncbi:hypothetical protein [uncultured Mailhella sp.]|nr:hypothetical protein [uncultured Mailhella sp.]
MRIGACPECLTAEKDTFVVGEGQLMKDESAPEKEDAARGAA